MNIIFIYPIRANVLLCESVGISVPGLLTVKLGTLEWCKGHQQPVLVKESAIEHISHQGALVTNFRLIKAGAIHRANGGYLLIDVRNLLMEPFSWAALKRVLKRGEIVIEDVSRLVGLSSTVTLEPDPIPLDVKVVLFGDRLLYFLMSAFDPELGQHFKVLADFDEDIDRSAESESLLGRLIASMVEKDALKPIDRDGVVRVIEHAARLADNSGKLTIYRTDGTTEHCQITISTDPNADPIDGIG